MATLHSAVQHVLRFFDYKHLPEKQQAISKNFHDLAHVVANQFPDNPETTIALRKLLEAKDAAVRASLPGRESVNKVEPTTTQAS